ncbi:MAG: hypothetical protein V8R46_09175 [Eubacterium ramulus]
MRRQGKGTFVRKPEYNKVAFGELNESENASFTSLVRNFGIEISNKLLCTGTIQGRYYYADKLGLAFEEPINGSTESARVTKSHWLLSTLTFH